MAELKKVLAPEDAPLAVRLVLADAASYNVNTGTGGVNGSIILSYVGVHHHMAWHVFQLYVAVEYTHITLTQG